MNRARLCRVRCDLIAPTAVSKFHPPHLCTAHSRCLILAPHKVIKGGSSTKHSCAASPCACCCAPACTPWNTDGMCSQLICAGCAGGGMLSGRLAGQLPCGSSAAAHRRPAASFRLPARTQTCRCASIHVLRLRSRTLLSRAHDKHRFAGRTLGLTSDVLGCEAAT